MISNDMSLNPSYNLHQRHQDYYPETERRIQYFDQQIDSKIGGIYRMDSRINNVERPFRNVERRIQCIDNSIDEKSLCAYKTEKIKQQNAQIKPEQAHMNIEQINQEKNNVISCPKFDQYKAYLYKLQHGFPIKDYSNYKDPQIVKSVETRVDSRISNKSISNYNSLNISNNNKNAEKRIINIKTTLLQPYNNYNPNTSFQNSLSRYSSMKNNLNTTHNTSMFPTNLIPTKFNLNLVLVGK